MVIAALVTFAILLAAWIVAPAGDARPGYAPPMTETLALPEQPARHAV